MSAKKFVLTILFFLFFSSFVYAQKYMPGEIFLKFKPQFNRSIMSQKTQALIMKESVSKISSLSSRLAIPTPEVKNIKQEIGFIHLKFPADSNIEEIIKKYKQDFEVEDAVPNYIRRICTMTPNDPNYNQQWGLPKISADFAWNAVTGDTSVIIAVIDTGIDSGHPDLMGNLMAGASFNTQTGVQIAGDTIANDDHGHGTHVAGIIGAFTNNGIGVSGVIWRCRLMPVKVMDYNGVGTDDSIDSGIRFAANNSAEVINLSLGGDGGAGILQASVDYARARNCVVVAAMGNEGLEERFYPAACDGVIAVGATDSNDNKATFSNFGDWMTVCAPGVSILSTYLNNGYSYMSGTSMATPFVSGVAALIFARYPGISLSSVELRLKRGVDDIGSTGKDSFFGYGRINAVKATGDFLTEVDAIKIYTYPNPIRFSQNAKIVIKNVPLVNGLKAKIFNIAGELVKEFREDEVQFHTDPDYASFEWNAKNNFDESVAAGVYVFLISDGTRSAVEKIMIIR